MDGLMGLGGWTLAGMSICCHMVKFYDQAKVLLTNQWIDEHAVLYSPVEED